MPVDAEFKLIKVYMILVLWAEINDFFAVEEDAELFLPLHRVVMLEALIRQTATICCDFAGLSILLKHQLESLNKAGSRKFRCLVLNVTLGRWRTVAIGGDAACAAHMRLPMLVCGGLNLLDRCLHWLKRRRSCPLDE